MPGLVGGEIKLERGWNVGYDKVLGSDGYSAKERDSEREGGFRGGMEVKAGWRLKRAVGRDSSEIKRCLDFKKTRGKDGARVKEG
jgi:hypothetical protein